MCTHMLFLHFLFYEVLWTCELTAPMYCFQGDKYKDQELDALDLFKECHYSNKKNGYTAVVQSSIVRKLSNKAHCNAKFFGYRPLQFCKFGELPLQFRYSETCHYNYWSSWILPFSTYTSRFGPIVRRGCVCRGRIDASSSTALRAPLRPIPSPFSSPWRRRSPTAAGQESWAAPRLAGLACAACPSRSICFHR